MVGNWAQDMLEGNVDKTLYKDASKGRLVKATGTVAVMSPSKKNELAQNPMAAMMFAKFPIYQGHVDIQYPKFAARISAKKGQEFGVSVNHRVIGDPSSPTNLTVGCKVAAALKQNKTTLDLGGRFQKRDKAGATESVEVRYVPKGAAMPWSLYYTKSLSPNAILTARLKANLSNWNLASEFGYKYLFGPRMNGTQITGVVDSKLIMKTAMTLPVFPNLQMRIHGEMNHFNHDPQQGKFPGIFGMQL